jgi:hypothetical protein
VGSFDNEWLKENQILDPDGEVREQALKKAVRVMMERLIKEEKFIPSQTIWAASFHHNTDNLHFHISLVEKENSRELVKRRQKKIEKSLSPTGMQIRFYRDQGAELFTTEREAEASDVGQNEEQFFERIDPFESETVSRKANNLRDNWSMNYSCRKKRSHKKEAYFGFFKCYRKIKRSGSIKRSVGSTRLQRSE